MPETKRTEAIDITAWVREMRELEARATAGPWFKCEDPACPEDIDSYSTGEAASVATVNAEADGPWHDRDLIVTARNALPALLDCAEALEGLKKCYFHLPSPEIIAALNQASAALAKLAEVIR